MGYYCMAGSTTIKKKTVKKPAKKKPPGRKPKPLHEQARVLKFIKHMIIDPNKTKAAIAAKYSKKSAACQGSRLYRNVKVRELIEEGQKKVAGELDFTAAMVLAEVKKITLHNPQDLYDKVTGDMIPMHKLPPDVAAGVVESRIEITTQGDSTTTKRIYKSTCKRTACELAGRYFRMWNPDDDGSRTTIIYTMNFAPSKNITKEATT